MPHFIFLFAVITIEEITFKNGRAGSSTYGFWRDVAPINGFVHDPNRVWNNWPQRSIPGFPQYIWYDFRTRRICPSEISFGSRQNNLEQAKNQTPWKFQLVGTNDAVCDQSSNWEVLCQVGSEKF